MSFRVISCRPRGPHVSSPLEAMASSGEVYQLREQGKAAKVKGAGKAALKGGKGGESVKGSQLWRLARAKVARAKVRRLERGLL